VFLDQAPGTLVGAPAKPNRIAGHFYSAAGLVIAGDGTGTVVRSNFIGVLDENSFGPGNVYGIVLDRARNVLIGGTGADDPNVIAGNFQAGIELRNNSTTNTISRNFIGTSPALVTGPGNFGPGVLVTDGSSNYIGGAASTSANIIRFNRGAGVAVVGGTGNTIVGNAIDDTNTTGPYADGLGIDLGAAGVTGNDPGDADGGPNNLQNFPEITQAVTAGGQIEVAGQLRSTPSTTFWIELFASPAADDTGNGEGRTPVDGFDVTTNGAGFAAIARTAAAAIVPGNVLTATATRRTDGPGSTLADTSEFSPAATVVQRPTISVADVSQPEGNGGAASFTFPVTLSNPSTQPVTVRYDTADGTATAADRDYVAAGATLTIPPGQTGGTISVEVIGDTRTEADEDVLPCPHRPVRRDDRPRPRGRHDPRRRRDRAGRRRPAQSRDLHRRRRGRQRNDHGHPDERQRRGDRRLRDQRRHGEAGEDYAVTTGSLTFNAGETSKTFAVPIAPDAMPEADEAVLVLLTGVSGASIGTPASATLTIRDDDPAPSLSIDDVDVVEGSSGGTTNAVFTVTLSRTSGQVVTVQFATANGSALAGQDYAASAGSLAFASGETTKTVTVPLVADRAFEPDETLTVGLSAAANASIARGQATGVIVDDDAGPCQPRPPVRVEVLRRNADDLLVTLSAGTSATTPINQLVALQLDKATNARVSDLLEPGAVPLGRPIQLQPNTQRPSSSSSSRPPAARRSSS
jgi:hypothetical protein